MNPIYNILGKSKRDFSRNRDIIDKKGNLTVSERNAGMTAIYVETEDDEGNNKLKRITVPYDPKIKVNVEKEIFKIIDNPKLTEAEKREKLKIYETWMKAHNWKW